MEANIKGFFDHVAHSWLLTFLRHRIRDTRVLRMIVRFLKARVVEEGEVRFSDEGTPQGGVISPLLANLYLHYALDLWFTQCFRKNCGGAARLIRYTDDFVVCFEKQEEAERFRAALVERLARLGLEVEPSKTRVLEFGPLVTARARQRGQKPETFHFLGFTHYCGTSRNGRWFRMKRRTARIRFRTKPAAFTVWLKAVWSTRTTRELWEAVCAKLRGHFAHYGVTDNGPPLRRFAYEARRLLFKVAEPSRRQAAPELVEVRPHGPALPLPTAAP